MKTKPKNTKTKLAATQLTKDFIEGKPKKVPASKLPAPEDAKQEAGGAMCDMAPYPCAQAEPDSNLVINARSVDRAKRRIEQTKRELEGVKSHEEYLLNELEQDQLRLEQALKRISKSY